MKKRVGIDEVAGLINKKFEKDRKKICKSIDALRVKDYLKAEIILMKMLCNYKIVQIKLVADDNE